MNKTIKLLMVMVALAGCGATKNTEDISLFKTPTTDTARVHYVKKGGRDYVYLKGNNLRDYTVVTKDDGLAVNVRGYNVKGQMLLNTQSNNLNSINTTATSDGSRVDVGMKKKQGFKVYRRPSGILLAMGPGYQEIADEDLQSLDSEVANSSTIDEDLDSLLKDQAPVAEKAPATPATPAMPAAPVDDLDALAAEVGEDTTASSELDKMESSPVPDLALEEEDNIEKDMGESAIVEMVKFNKLYDKSQLIIQTNKSVKYDVKPAKEGYNQFILDIPNASLSRRIKKSLDVAASGGVVTSVTLQELTGPYKTSRFVVQMTNDVKPEITQADNLLYIVFPTAEEINIATGGDVEAARQFSRMNFEDYLAGPTKFYGTRLSIEVAKADIIDVLRMIQEVSGVNIVVSNNVRGKVDVSLKNVPWDQALSVVLQNAQLGYVRQGSVIRVAPLGDLRDERKLAAEAVAAHQELEPLKIMVAKLNYINAKEAEEKVSTLLSKRGKASVDKDAKTLVINDIEEVVLKVDKMLKAIDVRPIQIAIEANIIEASEDWIRALGFSWATDAGDIAFKNISGMGNIGATIGLASINGEVKIISAPKICALDRQTASILQGTQVAYKTSIITASGETTDKIEFQNIEVSLNVTPKVTANNEIILDVNVRREFPDYTTRMNKHMPPGIGVRKATSQILLKDGDTAVIGGLYSLDNGDGDAGVPLMKSIPIVGWFFGKSERKEMRSELLIFIKAKVKNDAALASAQQ
ncbi:MAG: secretin and TonB N-terminal domain-containing protein [Pseudomonadota bacterium]